MISVGVVRIINTCITNLPIYFSKSMSKEEKNRFETYAGFFQKAKPN
jgi:hypothetical protein